MTDGPMLATNAYLALEMGQQYINKALVYNNWLNYKLLIVICNWLTVLHLWNVVLQGALKMARVAKHQLRCSKDLLAVLVIFYTRCLKKLTNFAVFNIFCNYISWILNGIWHTASWYPWLLSACIISHATHRTGLPPEVNQFFRLIGPVTTSSFNEIDWLCLQWSCWPTHKRDWLHNIAGGGKISIGQWVVKKYVNLTQSCNPETTASLNKRFC